MIFILLNQSYVNLSLAGDIKINFLKTPNRFVMKDSITSINSTIRSKYLVDFPTRVTTECVSAIDNK